MDRVRLRVCKVELKCPMIWVGEKGGASGEKVGGVVTVVGGGVVHVVVERVDGGVVEKVLCGRPRP